MIKDANGQPSSNAQAAIDAANIQANDILKKINAFFETDWLKYQAKVEAIRTPLFKKYEPLKID